MNQRIEQAVFTKAINEMREKTRVFDGIAKLSERFSEPFKHQYHFDEISSEYNHFLKTLEVPDRLSPFFVNSLRDEFNQILAKRLLDTKLLLKAEIFGDNPALTEQILHQAVLRWKKDDQGEYSQELKLDFDDLREFYMLFEKKELDRCKEWSRSVVRDHIKKSKTRRTFFLETLSHYNVENQLQEVIDDVLATVWSNFLWKLVSQTSASSGRIMMGEALKELQIKIDESKRNELFTYLRKKRQKEIAFLTFLGAASVVGFLAARVNLS